MSMASTTKHVLAKTTTTLRTNGFAFLILAAVADQYSCHDTYHLRKKSWTYDYDSGTSRFT